MPFKKGVTPVGAKPWKKGTSGNPGGRPKNIPNLPTLIASVLGTSDNLNKSAVEKILIKLKEKALKGDLKAAELLLNRAYGKAKQSIELSNAENSSFVVKVGYGKKDDQL